MKSSTGTVLCAQGPRLPTCFPCSKGRGVIEPGWVIPGPALCAFMHLMPPEYPSCQALAGVLDGITASPIPGASSLVGRMTQEQMLDPGTEHSWTGENPRSGVATGQPESRTARAGGGGRQEPDPEAPGRGLCTALSGEGPLDTFDQE